MAFLKNGMRIPKKSTVKVPKRCFFRIFGNLKEKVVENHVGMFFAI